MINNEADKLSKVRAYDFCNSRIVKEKEIGKAIALQKIHAYLFEGLYHLQVKLELKLSLKVDLLLLMETFYRKS